MSTDQLMQAIYLGMLAVVVVGYLWISNRGRIWAMLRSGAVWLCIFFGIVVAYGVWNDVTFTRLPQQSVFAEEGRIEVPRAPDGHYHLTLAINGVPVPFVVDTGASDMVLSRGDAARIGLNEEALRFTGRAMTANGRVQTARVRLDQVRLGTILDRNVPAVVNSGAMPSSLLGMSYLAQFERIELTPDRMVLVR